MRLTEHARKLDLTDLEQADQYLVSSAKVSEHTKLKDKAKKHLLERLGDLPVGILPDGRRVLVSRRDQPAETEPRKGFTVTNLTVEKPID